MVYPRTREAGVSRTGYSTQPHMGLLYNKIVTAKAKKSKKEKKRVLLKNSGRIPPRIKK
jgi:hypothetical protein